MQAISNTIQKLPKIPSGRWILCTSGQLWITLTGDLQDYVLKTDETLWCPPFTEALVQTLDRGSFCAKDSRQPLTLRRKKKSMAC